MLFNYILILIILCLFSILYLKLAEKYNKNGIFPLVVLLDKTGKIMGMTGFKNVSAVDYIELIHSFEK